MCIVSKATCIHGGRRLASQCGPRSHAPEPIARHDTRLTRDTGCVNRRSV